MLDRKTLPWANLFVRSFSDDNNVFFLQSDTKKPESRLGLMWLSRPILGADGGTIERIHSAFMTPFPENTMIQIGCLSIPSIDDQVNSYISKKISNTKLLREISATRGKFIFDATRTPLPELNNVLINRKIIIVTMTVLCDENPDQLFVCDFVDNGNKIAETFRSIGMEMSPGKAEDWLSIMRFFFSMNENREDRTIEDFTPLREQVFQPGNNLTIGNNQISFNDAKYFCRLMSVKFFPRKASLGIMNMIIGDPRGSANQITESSWMVTTIRYIHSEKRAEALRARLAFMINQSFSATIASIPMFANKKQGLENMVNQIDGQNAILVETNFTVAIFSSSEKRLSGLSGSLSAWANSFGLELREDKKILGPLFFNILPFGQTTVGLAKLFRYHTHTIRTAVQFLPLFGDWEGSGSGAASIFTSRRGQIVLFDPYDSKTNYNGVVFAESGAGKSFVSQQLMCDMLGQGGKVWVIDQGRSYQKLCSLIGGEFIEFSEDSQICLNPFTFIENIDEDMDMLKAVFAKMAAPESGLDDYRMSVLEQAVKATWEYKGKNSSVTDVAEWCNKQPDPRISDVGSQLYPFTRNGTYGRWFNGTCNINFDADFICLEIQELATKRTLQQVVLMLLLDRIGVEMYFDKSNRKKVVLVDEAWSLFDDPVVGKGIAAGFRKVRKNDGAMWIITQSIADLYSSDNGRVIIDNCAWQFIMQQRSESVENAISSGRLMMDSFAKEMLMSVHTQPGKYSEIMIRRSSEEWGIVRFIADRFSQILFSTKGWERNEVLDVAMRGGDVSAFIKGKILEEQRT